MRCSAAKSAPHFQEKSCHNMGKISNTACQSGPLLRPTLLSKSFEHAALPAMSTQVQGQFVQANP